MSNPMSTDSPNNPDSFSQNVQHSQATARVPEKVARGVCSTAAIVLQGPHEFAIDFLQRVSPPHHLVARVILPTSLMPAAIGALQENINNYTQRFGPPPALPPIPPNTPMPRIEEIYEQIKLVDETLAGDYANAIMVAHTPAEFCFDFILNLFPRSVVSCRVYMSAFHAPKLLESMIRSWNQYQHRIANPPPPEPQL